MRSGRLIRRVATLTVMFTIATTGALLAHATLRRSEELSRYHPATIVIWCSPAVEAKMLPAIAS